MVPASRTVRVARLWRVLCAAFALLPAVPALGQAPAAQCGAIVVSDQGGPYAEAAQEVARALDARAAARKLLEAPFAPGALGDCRVVVALGTRALGAVLAAAPAVAVVGALVPHDAYQQALARATPEATRAITAVYLDQPFARQLNLLRLVAPASERVGLLASPGAATTLEKAARAARTRGFGVVSGLVGAPSDLAHVLARLLSESDALLALPDATVFNASTVHNILFAALRERRPVIAFSPAYVRAGALAAVYSTPQQIGQQAGRIAAAAYDGAPLPPPQAPAEFEVSVNRVVAQALQLEPEDPRALVERLRAMERSR